MYVDVSVSAGGRPHRRALTFGFMVSGSVGGAGTVKCTHTH